MSKRQSPSVTWKNSPVKTFSPEEHGSAGPWSGGSLDSRHRKIHLRQDDEIYSLLLSRASSSFFNDDADHTPEDSRNKHREETPLGTPRQAIPSMSIHFDDDDKYNDDDYAKCVVPGAGGSMQAYSITPEESLQDRLEVDSKGNEKECTVKEATFFDIEYKRNSELMSTDYQLLQYVDFLKKVEKDFPTTTDIPNQVEFTSCDVLAKAVMEKVKS